MAGLAVFLFLMAAILSAVRPPLIDPDEGRNAEVAREMLAGNDYIVPSFHGLPYLDKPALFFDLIILSYRLFGQNEFSARLPSILFALGTLAVTWALARDRFGIGRAWGATAILASAPLFLIFARTVIFDMALTFFVALAIWLGQRGCRGWRWAGVLAWIPIALAVLVKGPVGLLLPILGTVALTIASGRPYRLGRFFHPLGFVVFAACLAPWLWAVEAREPGFIRYALLVETVERLTAPTFHRTGPVWYYVPILLLGLFPWSVAAVTWLPGWIRGAARGDLKNPSADRGFLAAFAAILVFFSLSQSKLGGYVLPAIPLAAILLSGGLSRRSHAWPLASGLILIPFGIAAIMISRSGRLLESWTRQPGEPTEAVAQVVLSIGIVSIVIGASLILLRRTRWAPLPLSMVFPVIVAVSLPAIVRYSDEISSRRIAAAVRDRGGEVIAVRCFPPGLDYYLGRVVPVVTETGREITSTYVERNYARFIGSSDGRPSSPGGGLWRPQDLDVRLRHPPAEGCVLITRNDDPPAPTFRVVDRLGRYRIWIADSTSPGAR